MAKDLHDDVMQAAQSRPKPQGFNEVPQEPRQTQQPKQTQGSALATSQNVLQNKAANAANQLAKVEQRIAEAGLTTALQEGREEAMQEVLAKQASYLETRAHLEVKAAQQRIEGMRKVRQNASQVLAEAVKGMTTEGDETDPLAMLSEYTENSQKLSLPSLF